ncbi:phage tail terminator family protein [Paenibacillus sp. FA6]|uniref:phage tail terminator family protein n=1 Tax=Paenibacillus sp. FA6 TaxID=3413029 RepID=UPI003F65822F
MINDVVNAIAIKLNQVFGEDYTIYTESVKQGLEEPCFFIVLLTSRQTQVIGKRYFREQPFDIHYFPSTTDQKTEMHEIVDRLNDALEYITTISGDLLRGTNINSEVVDGVLHFFVNYNYHIYKITDPLDKMEDLKIKNGLKG